MEPGVDLAVVAALVSSLRDQPLPNKMALVGEIGLAGEVRSVGQVENRIREAARLGFDSILVPSGSKKGLSVQKIQVHEVGTLLETVKSFLQRQRGAGK